MQVTESASHLDSVSPGNAGAEMICQVRRARSSACVLFLMDGMTFGTWAALLPSFQQRFSLSEGALSVVLLALIAGAMCSMPLAGKLTRTFGSHRVSGPAAIGFALALLLLALVPSHTMLLVAAFVFGLWKGAIDVAINSQAIVIEHAVDRPINGSFQGFWSTGGLTAAFILSLLMHQGMSPWTLMVGISIVMLGIAIWSLGRLLPDPAPTAGKSDSKVAKRPRLLWLLGGLAFLGLFCEGVMLDWSAVYMHTIGGLTVAQAPMGFAAFALCMAIGRFAGDQVAVRIGSVNTMRLSGLLLVVGIGVAVLAPHWGAILIGFALVGLGIANMVPVIFSTTGRLDVAQTGTNLATVTTMGYFGFLSGPPLIGFLATATGLPLAFTVVIFSGIVIITGGAAVVRKCRAKT